MPAALDTKQAIQNALAGFAMKQLADAATAKYSSSSPAESAKCHRSRVRRDAASRGNSTALTRIAAQAYRQISGVALRRGGDYSDRVKFRVIIEPDEDGVFVAECPALSGCVSQGKTREEAMANIRDAIQGYLHSLEKHGEPLPGPVTEEIIEVPV